MHNVFKVKEKIARYFSLTYQLKGLPSVFVLHRVEDR